MTVKAIHTGEPPARPSAFARLRTLLRNRPDGEHEMVINRLVIALLLMIYMSWHVIAEDHEVDQAFALCVFYTLGAWAFVPHLLWRPGASPARRGVAMALDITALSYCLHLGGAVTAILYPAYLWLIFGNGFRFGRKALFVAAVASIAGFALVITTTPYWIENGRLAVGLLMALFVLPAYAATLIAKLEKAREAAEAASRAKSHFLASVSHELRTPLNAVIGMTDLLDGTELDAEQRDMARTAGEAGRTLLGLIDELLDFSRLEAGRMPVNPVDFDLYESLAAVRAMLSGQAKAKGLRLALHVTPRTPHRLHGEARHIRDILVNLVGNAIKFTETGGIAIAADLVGGDAARPRLRFEVADTGIGIAAEARDRIFENFTQADETILNTHGGTGLGLAICRQLVELHGGRIGVESEPGVGSTFWFELDLAAVEAEEAPRGAPADLRVVALATEPAAAEALALAVERVGFTAAPATDLRATLRLLKGDGGDRRRGVVAIEAQGGEAQALVSSIRAADDQGVVEIVLIDPHAPAGLPDVDARLACASMARSADAAELAAMMRLASVGALPRAAGAPARAAARRLCVLVADDNRTNQKVIAKVLERAGHEVRVVDNGELALDALTERSFDLVLMDVNMPVLDGIECTKLYRFATIGKKRTPILALTADATPDARARCLEAGMDGCLTKPIEPERLLAAIEECVGAVAPQAEAPAAQPQAASEPEVDDEVVAKISSHPAFRPARRAVVDQRTLAELEELGGRDFLSSLVDEFVADAALVLKTLHKAMEEGEAGLFREQAHALRSGAANIGARGMYEICLSYRNMDARELVQHGEQHLQRLETEFERVRTTLKRQFPDRDADAGA